MRALLVLELRRQRAIAARMMILTVVIAIVFYAAGKRSSMELLAALGGSSLGAALIVPMGIARDKLEGTLDCICGLPVEPKVIAASRFAAMAAISLPWAVCVGALLSAVPSGAHLNPPIAFTVSWLAMLALGGAAIAALSLFELEQLLGAPMVALVIFFVLVPRVFRALVPQSGVDAITRLALSSWAPLALSSFALALTGVAGWCAFKVAERGIAAYGRGRAS